MDPYAPSMPDYARRNVQTETEVAPGVLRIDLGEPLPRQPHDPPPVIRECPTAPEGDPEEDEGPLVLPSVSRIAAVGARGWRDDYGITREH